MYKHTKLHSAMLLLAVTSAGQSREIYHQEDFSTGIPSGWTNVDNSGNNALWTWCDDPAAGQGGGSTGGCPPLWNDALNDQGPFAATSADNGFLTLDSDIYGNITHVSILTAGTLDLTAASSVYVEFEGFIGAYTVNPLDNAVFEVSNDGGSNWTTYNPYPNLVTGSPDPPNVRWSFNPTKHTFDVSAVAAGQPNVSMRWSWTGNFEYLWSIDDFVVADSPDVIFSDGLDIQPIP